MNAVPQTLEIPTDTLHSLEQKVYRTIELLKAAREGKMTAELEVLQLQEQLENKQAELESAHAENVELKKEREDVRGRVEKLLQQIDSIQE